MSAFPSDLLYQANAARRQEIQHEAALERRAAHIETPQSRGNTMFEHARRRVGWFLVALGNGLLRVNDSAELQPALEP
jgi:hypothetical protein